jgi:hypothetical protein
MSARTKPQEATKARIYNNLQYTVPMVLDVRVLNDTYIVLSASTL